MPEIFSEKNGWLMAFGACQLYPNSLRISGFSSLIIPEWSYFSKLLWTFLIDAHSVGKGGCDCVPRTLSFPLLLLLLPIPFWLAYLRTHSTDSDFNLIHISHIIDARTVRRTWIVITGWILTCLRFNDNFSLLLHGIFQKNAFLSDANWERTNNK